MWFRVEFNKDGSVASSTHVEATGASGKLVCYVNADGSAAAVKEALAWRKRYLEAARSHRNEQRAKAKREGRCRSCLRRKAKPGAANCHECAQLRLARSKTPHVLEHSAGNSPTLVAEVKERIRVGSRTDVSAAKIADVLGGFPTSEHVAASIASVLREMGERATAVKQNRLPQGGGRFSAAQNELEILLSVQQMHKKLSGPEFARWLSTQIAARRQVSEAA